MGSSFWSQAHKFSHARQIPVQSATSPASLLLAKCIGNCCISQLGFASTLYYLSTFPSTHPPSTVHFRKPQCNCMDGQTPNPMVHHPYEMWQSKSLAKRDTPARQILFNSTTSQPRTLIESDADAKSTKKKSKNGAKLDLHVRNLRNY